jgi:hypothetical protein
VMDVGCTNLHVSKCPSASVLTSHVPHFGAICPGKCGMGLRPNTNNVAKLSFTVHQLWLRLKSGTACLQINVSEVACSCGTTPNGI